jgi:hypothetical protein
MEGQTMKNDKTPFDGQVEENISLARRSALMKLGLATVAVYAAPALLTLSEAEAGGRKTGKRTGKKTGKRTGRKTRKTNRNSARADGRRRSRRSKKSRRSKRSRRSRRSR